jgi:ketosteroid isomerase-like protein
MTPTSNDQGQAFSGAGDQEAVREVIQAYAERMRSADVDGIVGLYTEDAAVMAHDQPTAVGRRQLQDVYSGALDAVAMDFTFTFDEVIVRGDTAVVRTRTDGKNTVRASGQEVPGRYRELFCLNGTDCGWKIAQYMFQPQPAAEE